MSLEELTAGQNWVRRTFETEAAAANLHFEAALWIDPSAGLKQRYQLFVVLANGMYLHTPFSNKDLEDCRTTLAIQSALVLRVTNLVKRLQKGYDAD
jgi:hypothetical protein